MGGDFNSEYEDLVEWMLDVSLQDMITKKHCLDLRTYNRSKNSPVYCCFGSIALQISKGEYLPFSRLHSDHKGVWIYIPTNILFGYKSPPLTYFGARHLKINRSKDCKKIPGVPISNIPLNIR